MDQLEKQCGKLNKEQKLLMGNLRCPNEKAKHHYEFIFFLSLFNHQNIFSSSTRIKTCCFQFFLDSHQNCFQLFSVRRARLLRSSVETLLSSGSQEASSPQQSDPWSLILYLGNQGSMIYGSLNTKIHPHDHSFWQSDPWSSKFLMITILEGTRKW